jgi:hypothetical protein
LAIFDAREKQGPHQDAAPKTNKDQSMKWQGPDLSVSSGDGNAICPASDGRRKTEKWGAGFRTTSWSISSILPHICDAK